MKKYEQAIKEQFRKNKPHFAGDDWPKSKSQNDHLNIKGLKGEKLRDVYLEEGQSIVFVLDTTDGSNDVRVRLSFVVQGGPDADLI